MKSIYQESNKKDQLPCYKKPLQKMFRTQNILSKNKKVFHVHSVKSKQNKHNYRHIQSMKKMLRNKQLNRIEQGLI